jgi:hypothetical protein
LESAVDSDDAEERDGHRIVARWLKHFLSITKEELVGLEKADREPVPEGDPEYMDFDSDSQERPSSSGGVPSGTQYPDTRDISGLGTFGMQPEGKPVKT